MNLGHLPIDQVLNLTMQEFSENDPVAAHAVEVFIADDLVAGRLESVEDMVELFTFSPGSFDTKWDTVPCPRVELDDIDLTNATCELRPEVWDG